MSPDSQYAERRRGLQGPELQSLLRRGWAPMPQKTIVTLVLSGLRVRLMRSVVTMVSIILAIAFLTYMGLSQFLYINVARDAEQRGDYTPVPADQVRAAAMDLAQRDIFTGLSVEQQQQIAEDLGYGNVDQQIAERADLRNQRRAAKETLEKSKTKLNTVNENPKALAGDKIAARKRADDAQTALIGIDAEITALSIQIDLGQWMQRGDRYFDQDLERLNELLAAFDAEAADSASRSQRRDVEAARKEGNSRAATAKSIESRDHRKQTMPAILLTTLTRHIHNPANLDQPGVLDIVHTPSRLEDDQFQQLSVILDTAEQQGHTGAALATLREMVRQEQHKRDARQMLTMLRRANINVQELLSGQDAMGAWLIFMALLTCTVGIANAMLMSVTERFREIGTMKCLGAQDWLVVKLFLLESGFLGVIGGAIGIVLGIIVAFVGALIQFERFGVTNFPYQVNQALLVIGLSVLAGMVLSVIGAGYPALVAARMQPVDALRVEE
ncbi:MAG: hypothetical protein CMJ49_13745 [Planctomycetaceae bacterium]|nr:hypothetical protein [Planctomycetaceae bacterium]